MADFLRGFRKFHFAGPCVTIFGSACIREGTNTTNSPAKPVCHSGQPHHAVLRQIFEQHLHHRRFVLQRLVVTHVSAEDGVGKEAPGKQGGSG